ncbi:hypothetical protein SODALDRAFT_11778 [Sodiomyces alkalinus F11]|uniref:Uncharacterized protein n=1 Tax=Sodiomyces alkalinus (strain CBS 110278 / VKM F-3762 / F11) TaxID=1314773 RepID=A0A3N2Q6J0_SODAK|nr:hypothetical protein SODALDRAFT_11778 [Sodiomyces alkalinus F11]ROT42278.1 hypothetical protein SODALDRAFT_11778 [Sodiomyces alkalinus F11]
MTQTYQRGGERNRGICFRCIRRTTEEGSRVPCSVCDASCASGLLRAGQEIIAVALQCPTNRVFKIKIKKIGTSSLPTISPTVFRKAFFSSFSFPFFVLPPSASFRVGSVSIGWEKQRCNGRVQCSRRPCGNSVELRCGTRRRDGGRERVGPSVTELCHRRRVGSRKRAKLEAVEGQAFLKCGKRKEE